MISSKFWKHLLFLSCVWYYLLFQKFVLNIIVHKLYWLMKNKILNCSDLIESNCCAEKNNNNNSAPRAGTTNRNATKLSLHSAIFIWNIQKDCVQVVILLYIDMHFAYYLLLLLLLSILLYWCTAGNPRCRVTSNTCLCVSEQHSHATDSMSSTFSMCNLYIFLSWLVVYPPLFRYSKSTFRVGYLVVRCASLIKPCKRRWTP